MDSGSWPSHSSLPLTSSLPSACTTAARSSKPASSHALFPRLVSGIQKILEDFHPRYPFSSLSRFYHLPATCRKPRIFRPLLRNPAILSGHSSAFGPLCPAKIGKERLNAKLLSYCRSPPRCRTAHYPCDIAGEPQSRRCTQYLYYPFN